MLSSNGWRVLLDPPDALPIPGTDPTIRLRVRGGDVAVVLLEVARRFHVEVESLSLPVDEEPGYDDWGWAVRPVRGQSTGYSNHASGTAIDLNATLHPRGRGGTFTRSKTAKVRRILASTFDARTGRNVVRWGRDYSSAPEDSMHFEINASPDAVARVASRIRAKHAESVKPRPKPEPVKDEEDDDMKSSDEIDLGPHSSMVLGQPDRRITLEEAIAIQTAAAVQTSETVHAMAQTLAALAADVAALRKNPG